MHPAARVSYYPPQPPPLLPRGASLGFRSFSALGSGAEVGSWGKKGSWERGGHGRREGVGTGVAGPTYLFGLGNLSDIYPNLVSSSTSKRTGFPTRCIESFPSSGWGLQKLEEAWNIQSPNSASVLASALLAQPWPSLLAYLASISLLQRLRPPHPSQHSTSNCGLPLTSPSSFGDPESGYQPKFLYWHSFCPSPEK